MSRRRLCKATRAKRDRSFAFQPPMSKLSWRRPSASCLRTALLRKLTFATFIDRVVIGRTTIRIQLSEVAAGNDSARILTLPWTRPSPYRKREIIQGVNDAKTYARPMRANARAILIEALRDAHRWLDELLSDPRLTLESIASREDKTERSIRMTLSLAFLAPEIVKAAVEGRLPRGFGLKRLVDLPMAWPDQWRALGSAAAKLFATCDPSTYASTNTAANSNSGNGNLRPETFGRSRRQWGAETAEKLSRPTDAAASRGNVVLFCGRRKSRPVCADFLVVGAAAPNRSPSADFLVTGKEQGNLSEKRSRRRKTLLFILINSMVCLQFPTRGNRELTHREQRKSAK